MTGILDISAVLLELGLGASATDNQRAVALQALKRAEGLVRRHLRYDPTQAERTEFYPQQDYSERNGQGWWEVNETHAYFRRETSGAADTLLVQHIPIRSIAHLYIDYDGRSGSQTGSFAPETEKIQGTDFWANFDGLDSDGNKICRDGLLRSFGLWPSNPGCVKVVYTAGYTQAELAGQDTKIDASPISDAVLIEAVRLARRSLSRAYNARFGFGAGPLQSESLGDYSYSLGNADTGSAYGQGTLSAESIEKLSEFRNMGYELAP